MKKYIIIIAILALATMGFLGSTIGLEVTRSRSVKDTIKLLLCNETPGYVENFLNIEGMAENYITEVEKGDEALFSSMLTEGEPFENGKDILAVQANTLNGAVNATRHIGLSCLSPGTISQRVLDRYELADGYSKMTYSEFLESQGIHS